MDEKSSVATTAVASHGDEGPGARANARPAETIELDDTEEGHIRRAAASVGCIVTGNHLKPWIATGCRFQERVVATVASAALEVVERDGDVLAWAQTPDGRPVRAHWDSPPSTRWPLPRALWIEPRKQGHHDLALLEVVPSTAGPAPVELVPDDAYAGIRAGHLVAMIGFRDAKQREAPIVNVVEVRGDQFWVKAHGQLREPGPGSLVLDLETGRALGLVTSTADREWIEVAGAPALRRLLEAHPPPATSPSIDLPRHEAGERAPQQGLEEITDPARGMQPTERREAALRNGRLRTARLEYLHRPNATAFLVGPKWLLTAGHALPPDKQERNDLSDFYAHFEAQGPQQAVTSMAETGVPFKVVRVLRTRPPAEEERRGERNLSASAEHLDYALLELAEDASETVVEGRKRGFFELYETRYAFLPEDRYDLFEHPLGTNQQHAEVRSLEVSTSGTRVSYTTNSLPGSSGGAIIDHNGRLVALHTFGARDGNVGVPISVIAEDIVAGGLALPRLPHPPSTRGTKIAWVAAELGTGAAATIAGIVLNLFWRGNHWLLLAAVPFVVYAILRLRALVHERRWSLPGLIAISATSWAFIIAFVGVPSTLQLLGQPLRHAGVHASTFRMVGADVPAVSLRLSDDLDSVASLGYLWIKLPAPCEAAHQLRDSTLYIIGKRSERDRERDGRAGKVLQRPECTIDVPEQIIIEHYPHDGSSATCDPPVITQRAPDQWIIQDVICNPS